MRNIQSTNEELLTSKEELQSLNEELTALNSQFRKRWNASGMTSDDLQNVLYSTNVGNAFPRYRTSKSGSSHQQ